MMDTTKRDCKNVLMNLFSGLLFLTLVDKD